MKRFSFLSALFPVLFLTSVMAVAGLSDGLVGHWEFENNFNDTSGNGNNGTGNNGATYANGPFGLALFLDGVNDYVRVPNSSDFQFAGGDFSVSVWVRPDASTDNARIVDTRGQGSITAGWMLKIDDNSGSWRVNQAGVDDGSTLVMCSGCGNDYSLEGWHHVVMIYNDDSNIQFYIDGSLDGTVSTGTLGSANNSLPLAIGASIASSGVESTPGQFFGGLIDDLRVYNRALTPSEVRELNGTKIMADMILNVPSTFGTIQDALESIQFKRIAMGATVTIQVADGTYSYSSEINIDHPDGKRIQILGNTTTPSNCTINFTNDANGFVATDGQTLGLLNGFYLDGDNGVGTAIWAIRNSQITTGSKIDITDFGVGIAADYNSSITCQGVNVHDNDSDGIVASFISTIDCDGATVSNNYSNILSQNNSTIYAANVTTTGGFRGLNAWLGSTLIGSNATVTGNTLGVLSNDGCHIKINGGTISGNTTNYQPSINTVGSNNSFIFKN